MEESFVSTSSICMVHAVLSEQDTAHAMQGGILRRTIAYPLAGLLARHAFLVIGKNMCK
jgi:hypothetical protein